MRRGAIGATLVVLGVLILLFEPVRGGGGCSDFSGGCQRISSSDWWGLFHYPPGWDKLAVPLLIVGGVLLVMGSFS